MTNIVEIRDAKAVRSGGFNRIPTLIRRNAGLIALAFFLGWCAPYVLGPPVGNAAPQPLAAYSSSGPAVTASFALCGRGRRIDCVVDGDTFYLAGQKIRIADIDTPEVSQPACVREAELGDAATQRLIALLNAGQFRVQRADRDIDRYGRKLRVIVRDGRSIGDALVAEGLAHRWVGHKESWCS